MYKCESYKSNPICKRYIKNLYDLLVKVATSQLNRCLVQTDGAARWLTPHAH